MEALRANTVELSREEWIKEAEKAEKSGAPRKGLKKNLRSGLKPLVKILDHSTAQSIISCVIGMDIDEEDQKHIWMTVSTYFQHLLGSTPSEIMF